MEPTGPATKCGNCGQYAVVQTRIPGRKGEPSREVFVCSSCGQGGEQLVSNAHVVAGQRAAKKRRPTAADRERNRRNR